MVSGITRVTGACIGAAPREFNEMPLWDFLWLNRLGQALPDLIDEIQTLPDAGMVDPQRLEIDRHARPPLTRYGQRTRTSNVREA